MHSGHLVCLSKCTVNMQMKLLICVGSRSSSLFYPPLKNGNMVKGPESVALSKDLFRSIHNHVTICHGT